MPSGESRKTASSSARWRSVERCRVSALRLKACASSAVSGGPVSGRRVPKRPAPSSRAKRWSRLTGPTIARTAPKASSRDQDEQEHEAAGGDPDRAVAQAPSLLSQPHLLGSLVDGVLRKVRPERQQATLGLARRRGRAAVGPLDDGCERRGVPLELADQCPGLRALTRFGLEREQLATGRRDLAASAFIGLELRLLAGQCVAAHTVLQVERDPFEHAGLGHAVVGRAGLDRRPALALEAVEEHAERDQRDERDRAGSGQHT